MTTDTTDTTDTPDAPDAREARLLLDRASAVGRTATATASWPAVAFLLGLGAAASMGTLAMGLTTGTAYFVSMGGLLTWVAVLVVALVVLNRSARAGFGRRWIAYLSAFFACYVAAMLVVGFSQGTNVVGTAVMAAVLLVVSVVCAAVEVREARR